MPRRRSYSLCDRQGAIESEPKLICRWRNGKLGYMGSMLREQGALTL